MSVRAFTLDSGNNLYSDMYGGNYYTNGISGTRAYRNATVSNQNLLVKNIARSHASELKEAYEYIEDGNVSAFQSVINGIKSTECAKQRTYNIDDSEIESAIEDAYQQVVGADYDTSIASTKQSSFMSGFNQNLFGGIFSGDGKSAAEYSAQRRGTDVNADEQAKKNTGKAVGVATTVLGTGLVATAIHGLAGVATGTALTNFGLATGILAQVGGAVALGPVGWAVIGAAAIATAIALIKK